MYTKHVYYTSIIDDDVRTDRFLYSAVPTITFQQYRIYINILADPSNFAKPYLFPWIFSKLPKGGGRAKVWDLM